MYHQETPYKVIKPTIQPPKAARLLRTCQFENGPYTGSERKVAADLDREMPASLKVMGQRGTYRLRPGTLTYVWVAS